MLPPWWWWCTTPRNVVVVSPSTTSVVASQSAVAAPRVRDVVLIVGTGALLAYAFRNAAAEPTAGVVVGTLTVALNVQRNDPDNILERLSRLSQRVDTVSTRGLQELLSGVALELLRQEKFIASARTQSKLYHSMGAAERAFQLLSAEGRSKVDRLTGQYLYCYIRLVVVVGTTETGTTRKRKASLGMFRCPFTLVTSTSFFLPSYFHVDLSFEILLYFSHRAYVLLVTMYWSTVNTLTIMCQLTNLDPKTGPTLEESRALTMTRLVLAPPWPL